MTNGSSVKASYVKVTITDANKGTTFITINGKRVSYPASGKYTKKGAYTITSTDKAGNVATFKFTLK